ncbi:TPA: hypothetical protein DCX16_03965 [bacterium]|nr:hypothetical protein [bacterium]
MKKKIRKKDIGWKFIREKQRTIVVFFLLLLTLVLRLIYLSHLNANDPYFYNPQPGTDMATYNNFAKEIINGTFSEKESYYYGPLYFYFLALIYKIFGENPYIAKLIQMIIGASTGLLVYLIGKNVFGYTVGIISLILFIFYAPFYVHEGVFLMESIVTFLNTLAIFLLLRVENKPSYKNLAFAGISIGLSALSRANILLFILFILIWMLKNLKLKAQGPKLLRFAFLCLIILLTISPATIRNYLVSGRFVLISTNGPILLWIGNNPYATGEYTYPPPVYYDKVTQKVKEKGDRVYIEEVVAFAKEDTKSFIGLLFRKLLLCLSAAEIDNNLNSSMQRGYSSLISLPIFIGFGLIGPLALTGLILSMRNKSAFLLFIFIFSGILAIVIMHVLGRHRLCFIPCFLVFAGFSFCWWYERIKKGEIKPILFSLILLFFSIALVYSQSILGTFYPFFNPSGIHKILPDMIIIKDNFDNEKLSKRPFVLKEKAEIKKKLIITEDIEKLKEVVLLFAYQTDTGGTLAIDINGKIRGSCGLGSGGSLIQNGSIKLDPGYFNKGENTIIIAGENGSFLLPIDESLTFGRSYFKKQNNEWEKLKKGEFKIYLQLIY